MPLINLTNWLVIYRGFHSNGATPRWMVYKGKYHLEMDDDWGYPILKFPAISILIKNTVKMAVIWGILKSSMILIKEKSGNAP